jgi:hypothetical protein
VALASAGALAFTGCASGDEPTKVEACSEKTEEVLNDILDAETFGELTTVVNEHGFEEPDARGELTDLDECAKLTDAELSKVRAEQGDLAIKARGHFIDLWVEGNAH